jgi:DNA-binding NarL/FixJ family response regulator
MADKVRVAMLDDHQSIIDGYRYRLEKCPDIEVVGTATTGDDLMELLTTQRVDVLILDVTVPTSRNNANPYPILHTISNLLDTYPNMYLLVISMHTERGLIKAVMEAGASGYILKDDRETIQELGSVITAVARGGIHFSPQAFQLWQTSQQPGESQPLTPRQLETISLCVAYPDMSTEELGKRLGVSNSTIRNLLSNAYMRLGVRNRTAAVAKARGMGIVTPFIKPPTPEIVGEPG